VRLVEGVPVTLQVDAQDHYQPTMEQIRRQWGKKSKALILASPANPTGTTIATDTLQEMLTFIQKQGGYLIMDEIYHGLEYDDKPLPSALNFSERVFVINSFSKFFGMTGWRLGWVVAPEEFIPAIDKLAQNVFLAPSTPAQYAALACFTPATRQILEERRQVFRERRDYLYKALIGLGFIIKEKPSGAFYLYADCSQICDNSFRWCEQLLEQQHVAVTPGIDFGHYHADTHVRFAYTIDLAHLEVGIERIKTFLSRS
jgi:aspartate/methionine/tyrosine aminotransferase